MPKGIILNGCDHPNYGPVGPVFKRWDEISDQDFGPAVRLVIDIVTESGITILKDQIFLVAREETEFSLYYNSEGKIFPWWLIGKTSGRHYPERGEEARAFLNG